MKRKTVTASQRVAELVAEHGSLRKVQAVTGVSFAQLGCIARGTKHPHGATLAKLGLSTTPVYEKI